MHPHSKRPYYTNTLDTILARCEVRGDCWIWTGPTTGRSGYGRVSYHNRRYVVHRLVYELMVGPIPPEHDLHHTCETPLCANPEHLQPMTTRQHVLEASPRCISYKHARATRCKRGHPLEGDNVRLVRRGQRVTRLCRACLRLSQKRWHAQQPRQQKPRAPLAPRPPRAPRPRAAKPDKRRAPRNDVRPLGDGSWALLLTRGQEAIVDEQDLAGVLVHRWYAHRCGARCYARTLIGGQHVMLARFILAPADHLGVRHLNGDPLDCRRANMTLGPRVGGFNKGPRNGQWKGDALNSKGMRHRAQRAFALPVRCQVCDVAPAIERHHRDGNPANNCEDNIVCCCRRCHMILDGRADQMRATFGRLSWEQVLEIRALWAAGGITKKELARRFGVSPGAVGRLCNGQSWRDWGALLCAPEGT